MKYVPIPTNDHQIRFADQWSPSFLLQATWLSLVLSFGQNLPMVTRTDTFAQSLAGVADVWNQHVVPQMFPKVEAWNDSPTINQINGCWSQNWDLQKNKDHKIGHKYSSWWFQIFFIFTTTWGNDPVWLTVYFSDGLKPPTSTGYHWVGPFWVFESFLSCKAHGNSKASPPFSAVATDLGTWWCSTQSHGVAAGWVGKGGEDGRMDDESLREASGLAVRYDMYCRLDWLGWASNWEFSKVDKHSILSFSFLELCFLMAIILSLIW